MKKLLFIFFFLFTTQMCFAQDKYATKSNSAIKHYETASHLLDNVDFDNAITELNLALKQDDQFVDAYLLLADVYRVNKNYKLATQNYLKGFQISPNFAPNRYFYLAISELNMGEYQEALNHFNIYKSTANPPTDKLELTGKYIEDCLFSLEALKHPVQYEPKNLGENINTVNDEYLPSITADENVLIFTRQIRQNEDFYRSIKKDTTWESSIYLSSNINSPNYNEGAHSLSPDGNFLFFTGCNRPDGLGRCDIYVSKREGKEWSKPINLGGPINSGGWESQPSLSADGRTLYFISDRPGGIGSYDIWKSILGNDGSWGTPENLGANVNTKYSEQAPFIHPDGKTLYFSSDGWPGLGNKDLFVSRLDANQTFSKPINLGLPINSCDDETGLTISSDGKKAFFSSDKLNGFGGLDIYSFEMPENIRPDIINYVKGFVFDELDKKQLESLIDIIDLKTGKSVYLSYSDFYDGTFLATIPKGNGYSLNVSKQGYLFYSENFSLDKYKIGEPITLEVPLQKIEIGKKVILKNIFYDTDKFDLKPESKAELTKLVDFLNENPKVKIQISGFTDNIGDTKHNLELSRNRAKAVYDYLIKNKIETKRLTYKGFGKENPVSNNDTETGRADNRRTEFTITAI